MNQQNEKQNILHVLKFPILILLCIVCIGNNVFAQEKPLPFFEGKTIEVNTGSLRAKFKRFTAFTLESKTLSEFIHQSQVSSFRLNLGSEKQWDIDLEPSNLATDYNLKLLTPEGLKSISSHPDFLFKGKLRGSNAGEQVRLSIKEGFIYGSVQTNGKEYFIEPLNRFTSKKEKDQYIVYETDDVLTTEAFSCGATGKELALRKAEQTKNLKEQSPQNAICKKIKFIAVADYSMYQKFGKDVYALESMLLSTLNLAESNYTTLNFGADGSTDVGTDRLQFEMEEIVVSTCRECDIAPGEENSSTIGSRLSAWASKNIDQKEGKIIQHWTANPLSDPAGRGLAGTYTAPFSCNTLGALILHYGTDDPAFLAVLVAHETGHALGCTHDDDVKGDVRGFIMYSGANANSKRFSTLADFGGINYSSQQTIRNTFLANSSCMEDCGSNSCVEVKDLKIDYGNFETDVQLSWAGSGNYLIKYKVNDSSFYDAANVRETSLNNISLKGLEPCTLYKFEIQRNCGTTYSKASSIIFKTSSLTASAKPVNVHGDMYDLELNIDCKKCFDKEYFIKIDAHTYKVVNSSSLKQMLFKDFFSDGARHRIDISKDSANKVCTATCFYIAPYYRSSSKKLLSSDFNDCTMPLGWKDSLLAKRNISSPDARWIVAQQNFFTSKTISGSLDSTCMIYYNNHNRLTNAYSGAISLTSPKVDLTKYSDIKLHYDYNFFAYKIPNLPPVGSILVEAFDGTSWQKIAERQADMPNVLMNIWDSIPSRVFIDLDKYKNKDFQLRFTVDDGSLIQRASLGVLAAFDNIVIDGYLKDSAIGNEIVVYPNPAKQEVFIQFSGQPITSINYRIMDASGRLMSQGVLNNYRINISSMTRGMYLLVLYNNGEVIGKKKILKY